MIPVTNESDYLTPESLLSMILEADPDKRLRLCRMAVDASDAASKCFMAGHEIEIDNLRQTIVGLSEALLSAMKGEPVDPVMARSAENAVRQALSTSTL